MPKGYQSAMTDAWIPIPKAFDAEDADRLAKRLSRKRIEHRVEPAAGPSGPSPASRCTVVVRAEDLAPVARLLREFWGITDPAALEPYTGACIVCGARIEGAWTCPACGISYRPILDPDDPVVAFIRDHGGFEAPS
jgi:hypothetical protein